VNEILAETKTIIQSYLVGFSAEFAIIAILNSVGLLILGIDYPILLGIIGALLKIVPYNRWNYWSLIIHCNCIGYPITGICYLCYDTIWGHPINR
jgi:hypothetical protein